MEQVRGDRFKVRAVVLGAFFVVLVSVWATYSEFIVRASRLNMSNFALALFVPFVLCALIVNPVLKAQETRVGIRAFGFAGGVDDGVGQRGDSGGGRTAGIFVGDSCSAILFCYAGEWVGTLSAQSHQTVDGALGRPAGDDMVF